MASKSSKKKQARKLKPKARPTIRHAAAVLILRSLRHIGYADQINSFKDKDGKRRGWDGHAKAIGAWKILMEARKRNGLHVVKKVA